MHVTLKPLQRLIAYILLFALLMATNSGSAFAYHPTFSASMNSFMDSHEEIKSPFFIPLSIISLSLSTVATGRVFAMVAMAKTK